MQHREQEEIEDFNETNQFAAMSNTWELEQLLEDGEINVEQAMSELTLQLKEVMLDIKKKYFNYKVTLQLSPSRATIQKMMIRLDQEKEQNIVSLYRKLMKQHKSDMAKQQAEKEQM